MSPRQTGLLLVAVCVLLRLPAAVVFGGEVGDMHSYRAMAEIVLRGDNIYHYRVLFPYTPLTLLLPALSLRFAQQFGVAFDVAVKLWPIAADAALSVLVWWAALGRGWPPGAARLAGLAYALNPVAILISAFHGNQTGLSVLGAFAAYVVLTQQPPSRRTDLLAATVLGLGIAARSFPVLLLPVFLICLPPRAGERPLLRAAGFGLAALLPTALASLPALLADAPAYLRELLSYSGFPDQGWLAIRRAWDIVRGTGGPFPPDTAAWLDTSKWWFLAGYGALLGLLAWRRRPETLAAGCILIWLLFYLVYGGVSTHYLGWVIPFGLLVAFRTTALYSLTAGGAMLGFYLTWFPAILLGRYAPPSHWSGLEWRGYLVTLVLAWGVQAVWFSILLARVARRAAPAR